MKRRTAIKNTAFAFGGILSVSAIASIFDSCVAPADVDVWTPDFFSVDEGKIITKIADILIPTTDSPGAVDALVPQYVDRLAKMMLSAKEQKGAKDGFVALNASCQKAHGKSFLECSGADQLTFLQTLDQEFVDSKGPNFFGNLKRTIYQGFFSSEEGATEVLKYDPVPGNYDGCVPYSEINGTWSL